MSESNCGYEKELPRIALALDCIVWRVIEKGERGRETRRKRRMGEAGSCCGKAWNRNALEMNRAAEKRKGKVQMRCEGEKKRLAEEMIGTAEMSLGTD